MNDILRAQINPLIDFDTPARQTPGLQLSPDRLTFPELIRHASDAATSFAGSAAEIDRDGAFPSAEFAELRRAGLLLAPLARRLGGASLGWNEADRSLPGSTLALLRVLEEVGRGNLAVGRLYEGHVNALDLLQRFGCPEQVVAWSEDVRDGKIFGVWNTQEGDGVRLGDETRDGFIDLSGSKTFASGAGFITRPLVTGMGSDGRWQMMIVPTDGFDLKIDRSWWQPIGMKASASYRVEFAGARISRARSLLGAPGDYYREPWFSAGAIRFAAVQLGGIRGLLEATIESLRRFGRTDDPYQKARVGSMAIAVESGRQWLRSAAEVADRLVHEGDTQAVGSLITHAQMTRTAIESIGQTVLRLAEQSVGARGLMRPHPIERIGRDLTMYLRQPGPDSALAQVGQAWLEGNQPPAAWGDPGATEQ